MCRYIDTKNNRETEMHKSEGINKLTINDVCPHYHRADLKKGGSCRKRGTERYDQSCY